MEELKSLFPNLTTLNLSPANSSPIFKCDKCKDNEFILTEKDGVLRAKECECASARRIERIYEKSGITEAFKHCTLENFKDYDGATKTAREAAQNYLNAYDMIKNDKQNSVAFLGKAGTGKTHLGIAILNHLMSNGTGTLYAPYKDMVRELKSYAMDDERYDNIIWRYTNPPVLFIDDLFKLYSPADVKYVYDVVNARYLARKPMIITSELKISDMLKIDEAVGSRIYEMCKDYTFEFPEWTQNFRLEAR